MNFRTTVGVGAAGCLAFIVYSALDMIIQALIVLFWILVAGLIVGAGVVLYTYWQRERTKLFRLIDGAFPLQKTERGYFDPNKMISAWAVIDGYGVTEVEPSAGWDIQRQIALEVQRTRHLSAMFPGDAAQEKTGGAIEAPKTSAATTKLLTGPSEKAPVAREPLALPAPVVVPPVVQRLPAPALIDDQQQTQLVIGRNKDDQLVRWDLELFPFARLHGATQSGKTSLARFLVAQAIKHGYEVLICDRRRGKDWGIFSQHAQLVDARDPEVLTATLAAEVQRYGERDAELGRNGAPNLAALMAQTGKAYARRLIVIEELGTQHMNAKAAGKELYTRFIGNLRKLTAEAGATGIHGLYIDQIPDAWDKAVRYNASGAIVFHLPDYGGQVAGYQMAHQLATYECHFNGHIVQSGYMGEDKIRKVIGGVTRVTRPVEGVLPGVIVPVTAVTLASEPQPGKWDDFARQFYVDNPKASQRALARSMAAVDPEKRPPEAFLGSLSSDLYHRFSPNGNKWVGGGLTKLASGATGNRQSAME